MTSIGQKKKAKRIAILSVIALLVVAALCFVFGYAISEGWGAVAAWFTSKWATMTLVAVIFVIVALVFAYFHFKDKEDFK